MAGLGLGLLLFGCGGRELSLTEYVDRLNAAGDRFDPQLEVLVSELERSTTPQEIGETAAPAAVEAARELDGLAQVRGPAVAPRHQQCRLVEAEVDEGALDGRGQGAAHRVSA